MDKPDLLMKAKALAEYREFAIERAYRLRRRGYDCDAKCWKRMSDQAESLRQRLTE